MHPSSGAPFCDAGKRLRARPSSPLPQIMHFLCSANLHEQRNDARSFARTRGWVETNLWERRHTLLNRIRARTPTTATLDWAIKCWVRVRTVCKSIHMTIVGGLKNKNVYYMHTPGVILKRGKRFRSCTQGKHFFHLDEELLRNKTPFQFCLKLGCQLVTKSLIFMKKRNLGVAWPFRPTNEHFFSYMQLMPRDMRKKLSRCCRKLPFFFIAEKTLTWSNFVRNVKSSSFG